MTQVQQHKTAVLVFANSSCEELKHKSFTQNERLFEVLTQQALKTVEKTGLPHFHFTEKQQVGLTFGERFTNAIQAIFDKGFDQVITIGNDSPQLQASHILEATNQLNNKKFVLGPSSDGGFYLMGIHRSQFNASDFKNLAWQTASLSKQLLGLVTTTSVSVFRLPTLFDIDTVQDITSLLAYAYQLPKNLLVLLLTILQSEEKNTERNTLFIPPLYTNGFHNKGSPLALPIQ